MIAPKIDVRGLQLLSLLSAGSIFALTGLRQFFIEPLANPFPNFIWFVIQVLPILLVIPGMLRQKARSFLLAALAAMLYFSHGVLLAVSAELRSLGLWEVGFAVALVATATFAVRLLNGKS
jgi:uncharacterized membrane protein